MIAEGELKGTRCRLDGFGVHSLDVINKFFANIHSYFFDYFFGEWYVFCATFSRRTKGYLMGAGLSNFCSRLLFIGIKAPMPYH